VTSAGLSLFNYQDDTPSDKHKITVALSYPVLEQGNLNFFQRLGYVLEDRKTGVTLPTQATDLPFLTASRQVL
jgi:hypothetical protein